MWWWGRPHHHLADHILLRVQYQCLHADLGGSRCHVCAAWRSHRLANFGVRLQCQLGLDAPLCGGVERLAGKLQTAVNFLTICRELRRRLHALYQGQACHNDRQPGMLRDARCAPI